MALDFFEKIRDDYYRHRGWDVTTGLQIRASLEALGLSDVAEEMDQIEVLG